MFPKPNGFPISESFLGIDDNTYTRGITELYLPYNFHLLKCEVDLFEVEALNIRETNVKVGFRILGDEGLMTNIYQDDSWKTESIRHFLSFLRPSTVPKRIAPIFCLMLNKHLRVDEAKLTIDGKNEQVLYDQSVDVLILPDSYPPLVDLPETENYKYYDKKTTVFYSTLKANLRYLLEVKLETDFSLEFAPFFPYQHVEFKNATINCSSTGDIGANMNFGIVNPTAKEYFPDWLQENLNNYTNPYKGMPTIQRATPFRGEFPLFNFDEMADLLVTVKPEKIILFPEDLENYTLNNYSTLRFMFMHLIPHGKDFEVVIRRKPSPLPVMIYNQLQNLPNYHDILVEYDVVNTTKIKKNLQIETEILGYSEPQIERVSILGMDNGEAKPARIRVAHCPRLKRGIVNSVVSSEKGVLKCKIINSSDKDDVIFEHTYDVDILPKDQMVWEVRDEKSGIVYNLRNFICSWIRPVDSDGLLDKVRADAIKYHPDGALGHKINSLEDIEAHVKAIYECLSKEYQIKYLSQPFNSRGIDSTQRVVLPEVTLKNRAGNCIDLTILFSSILEGFGIHPLLFIMPGHAFVGWGNPRKTDEMLFLETTLIGKSSFEEAKSTGEQEFKSNFLFIGSSNPLPSFLTNLSKGCYIIDVESTRKSGILGKK